MQNISPNEYLQMRMNDLESASKARIDPTAELERRIEELERQIQQMDGIIHAIYREVFNVPEP